MTDHGPGADPDLEEAMDRFFSSACPPGSAADVDGSGLPSELWESASSLGLPLIGVEEKAGGSGGSLTDLVTVLSSAGRQAARLPLAETHLAAYLLAAVGLEVPPGPMSVVPSAHGMALRGGHLNGTARRVPWARSVDLVVTLVADEIGTQHVVSFRPGSCLLREGVDLAGQPCDDIELRDTEVEPAASTLDPHAVVRRGALVRAAQMAGAIDGMASLTRRYVGEREQFGRPIGTFQAVQQHTVLLAQAAELTSMNVWRAAHVADRRTGDLEICAAKLLANEHARLAARAAHQAHGAIGMTREYPLHLFTRRLNTWRHDFGTELELSRALGSALRGATSLTGAVTDHNNHLEVPWVRT